MNDLYTRPGHGRLLADRPRLAAITVLAALAVTGMALLIAGTASSDTVMLGNGGGFLAVDTMLGLPGWAGWWLGIRRARLTVAEHDARSKEDIEAVATSLARVEALLRAKRAHMIDASHLTPGS